MHASLCKGKLWAEKTTFFLSNSNAIAMKTSHFEINSSS